MANMSNMIEQPTEALIGDRKIGTDTIRRSPAGISVLPAGAAVEGPRIPKPGEFGGNLAGNLDKSARQRLAQRLIQYRDADKESRSDWEDREKRSMRMLGLAERQPATERSPVTQMPGVHDVTHPMLLEACHQFAIRAYPELFPPDGLCKPRVMGEKTKERMEQATRCVDFTNFYLTVMDEGYYPDSDQMLFYLPMAGSAFRKAAQNFVTGMPELRYIKATSFVAPYSGKELKAMPRYAHCYGMSRADIDMAVEADTFLEVELTRPTEASTNNATDDQADGRTVSLHEDDANHELIEYHIDLNLGPYSSLGEPVDPVAMARNKTTGRYTTRYPYVVIVEEGSNEILMLRRNWKERDSKCRKRVWFTHHKFLPGLGFYGFGYPHVIGSLGDAASGVVNALLDAALASSMSGGFKTKEGRDITGEIRIEHGVWKDVEANYEDLTKSFYTPPFNPPSPALFQLLEGLITSGQRFSGTTEVAVGDAPNTAPVGTTLALQNEARKPQSAIHKRMCQSLGTELTMLTELFGDIGPDKYPYEYKNAEKVFLRTDFDGRVDVIPVADPNIYSPTQRIQQAQAIRQVMLESPQLFGKAEQIEALRRLFTAMEVADIDAIMPKESSPPYLDPVSENGLMLLAQAVKAFEYQDHMAHIAVHKNGLQWALASNADMKPEQLDQIESAYRAHTREHQALAYRAMIYQRAGIQPPPLDPNGMPQNVDPAMEKQISAAVVQVLPPAPAPAEDTAGEMAMVDAKIKAEDMKATAQIERDTQAFVLQQTQLDESHRNDERRKNLSAVNEQKRKDAQVAADIENKQKVAAIDAKVKVGQAVADEARKDTQADSDEGRKTVAAEGEQLRKDAGAGADLARSDEQHEQGMDFEKDDHSMAVAQAKKDHAQKMKHEDESHLQSAGHDEDEHALAVEHAAEDHERDIEFSEDEHSQELEQGEAAHETQLEQSGEDHAIATEQAKESGKLKIEQAKAAAKAKQAAAKKTAKKKSTKKRSK